MGTAAGSRASHTSQPLHTGLLLAVGALLLAGQVALVAKASDLTDRTGPPAGRPGASAPPGAAERPGREPDGASTPASALDEVRHAVAETLAATTVVWELHAGRRPEEGWVVHGVRDAATDRSRRDVVRSPHDLSGEGCCDPGSRDDPHLTIIRQGPDVYVATSADAAGRRQWIRTTEVLLGGHPSMHGAAVRSMAADVGGRLPLAPWGRATDARLVAEDPATGRRTFDVVLPGPAVSDLFWLSEVFHSTKGLDLRTTEALVRSPSTGTVTIDRTGRVVAASADVTPIVGDLLGRYDLESESPWSVTFRSIEVDVAPERVAVDLPSTFTTLAPEAAPG